MADAGAPAKSLPAGLKAATHGAPAFEATVLNPPARIASRWNGALRARLNRLPLEAFLRSHAVQFSERSANPLIEELEVACLYIVEPALAHRLDWRALCHMDYYATLGQLMARICRSLGEALEEPRLWRVAALRAMGRQLSPTLGIDMAASVAAAAIATFGFSKADSPAAEEAFEALIRAAVMNASEPSLVAARQIIAHHLDHAAQSGANTLLTVPPPVSFAAQPAAN